MPFLAREQTPQPTVALNTPATADRVADAEACRLTVAMARGDETAFRDLYDAYQPRVFRLALALGRGDETLAHDVVQSVFVTAAAKLRRVESEGHLWNWLARVARQHIVRTWQQRQRHSTVVGMAELPECPDAASADPLLEECLDDVLRTMDDDERQLVEWFYFDQLSHKEIAGRLDATVKAVSCRLERARAGLRAAMIRRLSHED